MKTTRIKKSSVVIWSLITIMLGLIIFSVFIRRKEPVAFEPPERAHRVNHQRITAESLDDMLLLPARIEPSLRARLPADKPGRITGLFVDRGDTVSVGDLLVQIDNRLWLAALEAVSIELREAEKEFNRWRDLEAAGAVSSSDMDQIRTRLDRARVQQAEATTHVSQCEVRSPADGVINERFVETGEHATEGMPVLELVVTDPVKLRLDVPERDAASLGAVTEIPFTVGVLPGRTFIGRVVFTAAAAQEANNAFRMDVEVENPDGTLKPGMIAEVSYPRGRLDGAIAVPLDAIIPRRGEHYVFVAEDGRAARRLVRIDRIAGSRAVIADGLRDGDVLVTGGHRALTDGALLDLDDAGAAP